MLMLPTISFAGFPVDGTAPPARYWRVRFPSGPSQTSIAEVEFRSTVGGVQLGTGAGAIASSNASGEPASSAFDGGLTGGFNQWSSATGSGVNSWIGCDLGSPVDIEEILLWSYYNVTTYNPPEIVVDYSHDGSVWYNDTRWPSFTGLVWNSGSGWGEGKYFRRSTVPSLINRAGLNSLTGESTAWSNYTLRISLGASTMVPGQGGTKIRFSLRSGANEGVTISKCYVGIKGSGTLDFASTPTQVTFGGNAGISVAANTTMQSDDISLVIGTSDSIVISAYMAPGTSAADNLRMGSQTGASGGFKAGDEATTLVASGYTTYNNNFLTELYVW